MAELLAESALEAGRRQRMLRPLEAAEGDWHLEASTTAATGALSDGDSELLAATVHNASAWLCRLCPTCTADCRSGLPVPEVMRSLMYAEGYGDLPRARKAFADLSVGVRTAPCESCPGCTAHCPNGVRVRDRLCSAKAHLA